MDERRLERLAGVVGITVTLFVGVPVLLSGVVSGWSQVEVPLHLWLPLYLTFVAAFVLDALCEPWRPSWLGQRGLFAVQLVTAVAVYLVAPRYGWSAVLLVVAAVSGAYVLNGPATVALVAVLAGVSSLGGVLAGIPVAEAMLSGVLYGSFLAFAALVVHSQRRATAAQAELASAHAQLRASSALLAESSATSERLRIARELHDLVGHQLTALSLELEVAGHHTDGEAKAHVGRARDVAKGLLTDVRRAVGELRAPTPGLSAPLEALVDGLPGLDVHLRVLEEAPVDEEPALAVVRCVQEVVTNTVRHAGARNLWLTVTATDDGVRVEAQDDGRGSAAVTPGNGLTGMRERLEQLGGELQIRSSRGRGFAVTARVPAT